MSKHNFDLIPQVRFNRSRISMPHGVKTSMSVGKLYPISCVDVLPGDTFKTDMTAVSRVTSAFLKPVVDNLWMDVYHFYVPLRLLYNNAEGVFGDPNPSSYLTNDLDEFPTFDSSVTISEKSVFDYLGCPTGTIPKGLSVMKARAFALIYDKWFRNENVISETYVNKGAIASNETPNNNPWSPTNYTGQLPFVSKKKDYFTSCLPKPQKGVAVSLPLGLTAPVKAQGSWDTLTFDNTHNGLKQGNTILLQSGNSLSLNPGDHGNLEIVNSISSPGVVAENDKLIYKSGLVTDLRNATSADVNDLRFAFQLQKMLERDALYGSRYNEYLLAHYGVSNPDSRVQIPEYLGGARIPLNVTQVTQTSEGTTSSPLGNLAGYSLSGGHSKFSKGFTEHGFVISVACIRTLHTYQQGLNKSFFRSKRNDYYDPLFANLGEQPVYTSELYLDGTESDLKANVFGYNEAWADYRYIPSIVTGEMRSSATNTLDIWHFGDKYNSRPTLSESFINETSSNIDRTLAVPSNSQDNFLVDFWFNTSAIRVMPTYSVPGLIDHH